MTKLFIKTILLFKYLTIFVLFFLFNYTRNKINPPNIEISMQEKAIHFNKDFFSVFNVGQKRMITDIFWIKTLLDSDIERYKGNSLNSWMFKRFDLITTLDPYFYEAYVYGGQYLSVIKDDKFGARNIFEKGLIYFPQKFHLNFYAGMHDYLEFNDYKSAYDKFYKIRKDPKAPRNMKSIISKLLLQQGKKQSAYQILLEAYRSQPEHSFLKERYAKMLYSIKAEIDLNCLNTKKQDCDILDFEGNKYYLGKNSKYMAQKKWEKVRLGRKNRN